jgi:hypothetical protein
MKKYINMFWIAMAATAAVAPLFRMIPGRNWTFYIIMSALIAGYINYKAMQHVIGIGQKLRYFDMEELKNVVYTRSGKLDPATTPRAITEELAKLRFLQTQNYIYIVIILLLAAFYVKH